MSKVLVLAESANGHLKRSSQELIQASAKAGHSTLVALFGAATACSKEAAHHGASEVHGFSDSKFDRYSPELMGAAFADLVKSTGAEVVLGSASSIGRDLFPKVAARLGAGLVSDATSLDLSSGNPVVQKPLYAGKCFATASFASPVKMILMRPNQLPVTPADTGKSANVVDHATPSVNLKALIQDVVKGASEKMDLTEANIIVSGGRGLKEAGNFKMLHELAEVLGATVGASRAVVDQGWVPHDMQVGQTGKTVAPTLYIAVGISGAIQHLAGMSGSKVIVAINNDASAPIFQKATYGLVGDAFEIVPKLTAEFKRVLK